MYHFDVLGGWLSVGFTSRSPLVVGEDEGEEKEMLVRLRGLGAYELRVERGR